MSMTVEKPDPILLAFDGGENAQLCARILQQQGFRVEGVYFLPAGQTMPPAASEAAKELHIPLDAVETTNALQGPALLAALVREADSRNIRLLATGHFARVEDDVAGSRISPAVYAAKDQSAGLEGLAQETLARLCLPMGEFGPEDIDALASEAHTPPSLLPGAQ